VIVTNQSGLARGLIAPAEGAAVAARVAARFAAEGVRFSGAYVCPHGPDDGCPCRKPAPGLLLQAACELGLDLAASVMIGDKPSDVAAGRAAGCAVSLRLASRAEPGADEVVVGWPAAGRRIASVFGVE